MNLKRASNNVTASTVWCLERIKSDTRYLEVPDYLKKQIEKLESTIHDYIEYRYKANVEVQTILNNTLIENGLSKCEISI